MLKGEDGSWIEDRQVLKNLAVSFFSNLFRSDQAAGGDFITGAFPKLDDGEWAAMEREVTIEETKKSLSRMGSYKAPGPDGYQAIFYKRTWHITGSALHEYVRRVMAGEGIPKATAEASLVLIPKEKYLTSMRGFRPLSLCNVPLKIVSKIIVGRMKDSLRKLISSNQTSFVPGRSGIDNAIVCQELIHSSRYTKARKGAAIVKVDLEKAYDRIEWSFVKQTLEDAGAPSKLTGIIMDLVSSSSCRLIWNGELTDEITPSRGLRQGDPLSPYLFVLCMERLGHWLMKKVEEGRLRPLKIARRTPGISYLFFADDLLLFAEADEDQLSCLREGLEQFFKCSGQKVNYTKSSLMCSSNIPQEEAKRLSDAVGIPLKMEFGKYLGCHMLQKGRNKEAHMELMEHVKGKLQGWKARCLSRAGRLTLAQTVLGSIPIFQMQIERLPKWVCMELDKAVRSCVWVKHDGERGMHLIRWETIIKPKRLGGANLRSAEKMNWAMLAKLAWRLLKSSGETWAEVLKAKYSVAADDGACFKSKQRSSHVWKGIVWGRNY